MEFTTIDYCVDTPSKRGVNRYRGGFWSGTGALDARTVFSRNTVRGRVQRKMTQVVVACATRRPWSSTTRPSAVAVVRPTWMVVPVAVNRRPLVGTGRM